MNLPYKTVRVFDSAKAGRLLREKRQAAGLSLRAAAALLGVSFVYIGQIERNERHISEASFISYSITLAGAAVVKTQTKTKK